MLADFIINKKSGCSRKKLLSTDYMVKLKIASAIFLTLYYITPAASGLTHVVDRHFLLRIRIFYLFPVIFYVSKIEAMRR